MNLFTCKVQSFLTFLGSDPKEIRLHLCTSGVLDMKDPRSNEAPLQLNTQIKGVPTKMLLKPADAEVLNI